MDIQYRFEVCKVIIGSILHLCVLADKLITSLLYKMSIIGVGVFT